MSGGKILKVAGVAAFLAAVAWIFGFLTALEITPPAVPVPDSFEAPAKFVLFNEVWAFVRDEFYGTQPTPEDVTVAAVDGLVDSLPDAYAEYWSADEITDQMKQAQPDLLSGIGAWVERAPEGARVVATVPDSPARRAGIVPNQIIVTADDETLGGLEREEMLALLGGEAGSAVTLRVFTPPIEGVGGADSASETPDADAGPLPTAGDGADSSESATPPAPTGDPQGASGDPSAEPEDTGGSEQLQTVEITRADIPLPLVEVRELDDGVAYLRLSHFGPGAAEELDAALSDLEKAGASELVLDLRDNPGGEMETLREVASRFVDGPLWIEVSGSGETTVQSLDDVPVATFDRIAVLVNGGTASAAELLAGLLRESSGAVLVGSTTFGKSAVQGIVPLTDGSMLRLTVAEWRSPGGLSVAEGGIEPDRVELSEESQLEAALAAAHQASRGG